METVQLPCNHCGQLMTVSVEHMGIKVHCPHCQAVVQVPAAEVMTDKTWLDQPLSNEEKLIPPPRPPVREETPKTLPPSDATTEDLFREVPLQTAPKEPSWMSRDDNEEEADELPETPHISRPKPSMVVPILLLFLIPYALAMSGWVAYLIYRSYHNPASNFDPLERLPDPKPGDGGPRQITHDTQLPARLKTQLHQALSVGDLEVTATKVEWTKKGDMTLVMKMRNISSNVEFFPVLDDFAAVKNTGYTFVQPMKGKIGDRLYGGTFKIVEDGKEKKLDPNRRLKPNQEMIVRLTTPEPYRKLAEYFKKNPQEILWRVQVRRGFLDTRDGPKSATAVVGVQFNTSAIAD